MQPLRALLPRASAPFCGRVVASPRVCVQAYWREGRLVAHGRREQPSTPGGVQRLQSEPESGRSFAGCDEMSEETTDELSDEGAGAIRRQSNVIDIYIFIQYFSQPGAAQRAGKQKQSVHLETRAQISGLLISA